MDLTEPTTMAGRNVAARLTGIEPIVVPGVYQMALASLADILAIEAEARADERERLRGEVKPGSDYFESLPVEDRLALVRQSLAAANRHGAAWMHRYEALAYCGYKADEWHECLLAPGHDGPHDDGPHDDGQITGEDFPERPDLAAIEERYPLAPLSEEADHE